MKGLIILIGAITVLYATKVHSSERHEGRFLPQTGPQGPKGEPGKDAESIVNNYSITNNYSTKGVTAAMALSGASYDWSSEALQWSVSGSYYNNEEGFAAGLAQRFGSVLVNVNIARGESGSTAYVIGGSGRF